MVRYYYELSEKTFVNPYHFVPLENECRKEINYIEHRKQKDLKTGWIECELKTLTPIFIPNTTNDDFFQERINKEKTDDGNKIKSYDFFSYRDNSKDNELTDTAVIPGSSIRGVIRSAFETLTNSCMSTIDDDKVLYKRVTKAAKPGRLVKENKEWKIVECEKFMLKIKSCNYKADPSPVFDIRGYEDKQKVYIKPGKKYGGRGYMPRVIVNLSKILASECNIKGYFHKGEPFGNRKHHESVFVEKNRSFKVSKQDVENLLTNYKLYQDETVNLHKKQEDHNGYESNIIKADNETIDSLNGSLIYYVEHNNKYYLSPAAIGREVFHNRLEKLVGSYSPCDSYDKLCPACALFGFAGHKSENNQNKDKNAIASRICFSDAKTDSPKFYDPVILPELAGPKISSTELYLKKPHGQNVAMWNYDYAECKNGKKDKKIPELKGYSPQIQGRKFYWHHENITTFENENKIRFDYKRKKNKIMEDARIPYSDRLVKVRPVDKDVKFTFRIHFNQLAKDELDRLLWTLSIGDNDDLAHKIGMGKPVGLGSVQIKIHKVILRKLSIENGSFVYDTTCEYTYDFNNINLGCNDDTKKAFEKIANFKNKPKNIHYPYCIDEQGRDIPENYEWFVGNKQINGVGTGTNHVISEYLRPINPENNNEETLKVIKKCAGKPPKTHYFTDQGLSYANKKQKKKRKKPSR